MTILVSRSTSSFSTLLIYLIQFLAHFNLNSANTISSYIYLNDKHIKEELAAGSFVLNLAKELETNQQYLSLKPKLTLQNIQQQYTLLEDSNKPGNANQVYFNLDSATGQITTKSTRLDREFMCANRQCANSCELGSLQFAGNSCRLNLKILLMPSYNIVNLNIVVEDVNDNRPEFRLNNQTQFVNENVPVGYKIPIDLAYDPDVGVNTVQRYEIMNNVDDVFKLEQNLNDSQLFLVVQTQLDREDSAEYSLAIRANDGVVAANDSKSMLYLNVQLVDINDNSPVFERDLYKFVVQEDTPIDTEIGRVTALDLDTGLNAQIRYSFAETSPNSNMNKPHQSSSFNIQTSYFSINETTGSITLKSPLDFEKENSFLLTIEAVDSGVGSLPAYTQVEISLTDVNDNLPEITVSYLSTLNKTQSQRDGFKYDVFLLENAKVGKFVAHVSIVDKDSGENGRFEWEVYVDGEKLSSMMDGNGYDAARNEEMILKLVKLNQNSFTLNVGSTKLLDREKQEYFDVSIVAWDYGEPRLGQSVYNFTIRLVDVNDNAPRFEQPVYDFFVHENNEPFQIIAQVNAHDLDSEPINSNITYSIKEKNIQDFFFIDHMGSIHSKIRFDRETVEKYIFHVQATDAGQPPLHSTTLVNINILDVNDNFPMITFNSSFYHRFHQISSRISSAYFKLGETISPGTLIMDFKATDRDLSSKFEFSIESASSPGLFKLTSSGQLYLAKKIDKKRQSIQELNLVCKDSETTDVLNSTIKLTIEITDQIEYCIRSFDIKKSLKSTHEEVESKQVYINRDQIDSIVLFNIDYSVERHFSKKQLNRLSLEQHTHVDLIESNLIQIEPSSNLSKNYDAFKLELKLREDLIMPSQNRSSSKLMLGKYSIRVSIFDRLNPTCTRQDLFNVYVGNNFINENELISFLKSVKNRNSNFTFDNLNSIKKMQVDDDYDTKVLKLNNEYLLFGGNSGGAKVAKKSQHKYLSSDFILLFILILIIVITALFLTFVSIGCIYGRYKKQYRLSTKKVKQSIAATNNGGSIINARKKKASNFVPDDEEFGNEESLNFTASRLKTLSAKKKYLNTSTSSSETNSDELGLDKPQYTRVHSQNGSSSNTSNGTLVYKDDEDFGPGVITSCNGTIRQYQPLSNKTVSSKYQPAQTQRYFYSITASKNQHQSIGYETNRSNSAAESSTVETTTTIDECCSKSNNSNNNEFEQQPSVPVSNGKNLKQLTLKTSGKNNSSDSSAYSCINTSDNLNSDSDNSNKMTNLEPFEEKLKNTLDSGLLSFKKHHHLPKHIAPIVTNKKGEPTAVNANTIKNLNTNNSINLNSNYQTTRASFDL